ncbi:uncharacterized protein N7443_003619 [Penicillium atrosanguineum]|uniref:uncharacterized protein n=1 Tax=Penicillium atrosanguineum TaxID=1132637 RepID=UPI0023877D4A|nr:uncharacterized protein N7443_003619 [Penicillium atrosanguineum]KAJ5303959.1 hypothetical protein N7443_003619 [Penicillium atrosanguineum]
MDPQITQNTFCTYTGSPSSAETTIFFISGNPGLIGYYHPFLSFLAQNLVESSDHSKPIYQIYGCSLGGFEVDENPSSNDLNSQGNKTGREESKLYDLEDQIRFVHQRLETVMSESGPNAAPNRKAVLIGHSVGAYIAMEVIRRHRAMDVSFDIVGGVMLFPTVMDIAASPSGQKLTGLLSIIPRLALVVGFFARLLTFILPVVALRSVVGVVMKDPPGHALDTTCTFLRSRGSVRQALYVSSSSSSSLLLFDLIVQHRHMAADEMRTITSDKWTDDVWGVAHAREPITKMFFYFGVNDHWVAEKTRDDIIAARGEKEGSGTKMFVCEEGLPHAFCIKHSETMARKVADMIQDITSA